MLYSHKAAVISLYVEEQACDMLDGTVKFGVKFVGMVRKQKETLGSMCF